LTAIRSPSTWPEAKKGGRTAPPDPAQSWSRRRSEGDRRRQGLRQQGQPAGGIIPVIPRKVNEKGKPAFFAKDIYKGRARIGQAVGKLKRFKRVALRCEKTKRNFAAIVVLAAGFILVKSVHTA
jgi:hypothetical protein